MRLATLLEFAEEQRLHQDRFQAVTDDTVHLAGDVYKRQLPQAPHLPPLHRGAESPSPFHCGAPLPAALR